MKRWLWSAIFFSCCMSVTDTICCLEKVHRDSFELDNNRQPQNGHHFDLFIGDPFDKSHMDRQLNEKRELEKIFGPSASGMKQYRNNAAARRTIMQKNQKFPKDKNGNRQPKK